MLLDDVITQGGQIAELRHYIENRGGRVVAVTSLACARFSSILAVRPRMVWKLKGKYGQRPLERFLKENRIAGSIHALTQSEARYIGLYRSLERLWARVTEEQTR